MGEVHNLSGRDVLDRILEQEHPRDLIRQVSGQDFFWLLKKVGDDDALPLLELASEGQWQYLLDLELWNRDRLDMEQGARWINRLLRSDPQRLAQWLYSEGRPLAYYFLKRNIQVHVKEPDAEYDLPESLFTLDQVYYFSFLDPDNRETAEMLLRALATTDHGRYQALILSLTGVLPAEAEEELYRRKNVRLAEHGFLSTEEAMTIYGTLSPESLLEGESTAPGPAQMDEEIRNLVPMMPLQSAGSENVLMAAVAGVEDPLFLDRIRLEFAGLCNQILSAESVVPGELEVLVRTCRKAGGYLNLALEKVCAGHMNKAEQVLKTHALVSIFRVGFGLVMDLKWETERWMRKSWFWELGQDPGFWGEDWGGILAGLIHDRPQLYVGLAEGELYRDFERLSELETCREILHRVMELDRLLRRLTHHHPLNPKGIPSGRMAFYSLLFSLWAGSLLGLEPGFQRLSSAHMRDFFLLLREGDQGPPYRMTDFQDRFVGDLLSYVPDWDPAAMEVLKDTLVSVWGQFREEYEWVTPGKLDRRFCRFLL